jgi:outer membrane protein assembly factor BamB
MKHLAIITVVASLVAGNFIQAENWNQWRGTDRADHSPDKGLLKEWPANGPTLKWIFKEAGIGYSGPAIVENVLYTLGAREDEETLIAVDAKTGTELWHLGLAPVYDNNWGNGPRSTPSIDAGVAYVMTAKGDLSAVDLKSKKLLWKVSMTSPELGGKLPGWGYTESPLVDGNQVVCTPGGKNGAMVAVDKATGKVLWQSEGMKKEAWYSSAVKAKIQGKVQYVQFCHENLFGVEASSGKVLWSTPWRGGVAVIPTPIIDGNSVYVTSGYKAGCKKVTIGADMSVTTDYDMENDGMVDHHGGVIALDGHIYGHSDKGGWTCQKIADGTTVWQNKSLDKGAIGYADGMFYCLGENKGDVALIEATTQGWTEKGRFTLAPQTSLRKKDGRVWTHPVILDGNLYLRDQELVFCFDVKAK